MLFNTENLDHGGINVMFTGKSLDFSNVNDFKAAIRTAVTNHHLVLVDMKTLQFVDSSGLGAMLSLLRTMNDKGGSLKLYNIQKPVLALFELVKMNRLFAIFETKEDALR